VVSAGDTAAPVAKAATSTIPIVFSTGIAFSMGRDPVTLAAT
jgi:hypothetical protein